MLGYEKEYAVQRTKCTDERTWQRFRGTLEANMLHDLGKTTLQMPLSQSEQTASLALVAPA